MSILYLDILVYGLLVALALRNVWVILVRQQEYKNLPILTFYVYAVIALGLRFLFLIIGQTEKVIVFDIDYVQ